jgi:hypothetical protein
VGLLPVAAAVDPAAPAGTLRIGSGATLAEATEALLASDGSAVDVVDGDRRLGAVTLASIQAALRRPIGDDDDGAAAP